MHESVAFGVLALGVVHRFGALHHQYLLKNSHISSKIALIVDLITFP